ncbi:MAG: hypothetical protein WB502_09640 [Thermoactinomyces sp.]
MQELVEEIKTGWKETGVTDEMLIRLEALLLINRLHCRKEEQELL